MLLTPVEGWWILQRGHDRNRRRFLAKPFRALILAYGRLVVWSPVEIDAVSVAWEPLSLNLPVPCFVVTPLAVRSVLDPRTQDIMRLLKQDNDFQDKLRTDLFPHGCLGEFPCRRSRNCESFCEVVLPCTVVRYCGSVYGD